MANPSDPHNTDNFVNTNPMMVRFIGVIMFVFGGGIFYVIYLFSDILFSDPYLMLFFGFLFLIGWFCMVVSYRYVLLRPNKYNSIMPPYGWYMLATVFLLLTIILLIVSIQKQVFVENFFPVILPCGLFAYWSARRGLRLQRNLLKDSSVN